MPKGRAIKSPKQLGAMYAAAAGKSTLGIPKRVGKKLIAETSKKRRASLASQMMQHVDRHGRVRRAD